MIKSIILDATHFATGHPTGVEYYVDQLLPLLSRRLLENNVAVSWIGHSKSQPNQMPEGVRWIYSLHTTFWSQRTLLRVLNQEKPDLFFSPSGLVPLLYRGKIAIAIHDLGIVLRPQDFSSKQKMQIKAVRQNAKKATCILTPTQFTAEIIRERWSIPGDKIAVIPYGYSLPDLAEESVPGVQNKIILYVGRIERKKNLLPVIQAFAQLPQKEGLQLVLAGKDGYGAEEVRREVQKLSPALTKEIILPGYISEGQKKWLYNRAEIAVFPSRAEGFGFPVLEAFAYGVPLLCSNTPPLPEVGGNAPVYVKGYQAEEWGQGIERLLRDSELREQCSTLGKERLQHYTWPSVAQQTVQVFLSL